MNTSQEDQAFEESKESSSDEEGKELENATNNF